MKKLMSLLLAAGMLFALAACGGRNAEPEAAEWTRQGSYEDGNGNLLLLTRSETEGYEGWAVTFMLDGEMIGWIIQQEGNTLRGNLRGWDENEEPFVVTISEEGADGLKLEVEGGEAYHFTPMDIPDATIFVSVNTYGLGRIAYAEEGEEPQFDDDFPAQSIQLNLAEPTTYVMEARADKDWVFVKWTKNGEDYSTEKRITVELAESADFVAVFDLDPDSEGSRTSIKEDPEEAEYQIVMAMQHLLAETYGDKVDGARIFIEKIYSAEEEQADALLRSYALGADEVAFAVRYELYPAEGVDVNELLAGTGEYDEASGCVKEKYNVGILRPNPEGEPAYVITDFGTAF